MSDKQALDADEGVSLYALGGTLLRHWRILVAAPSGGIVVALLLGLLLPGRYTAEAVYLPQVEQSGMGRLSGLASQFGLAMGGLTNSESIELHAALVTSGDLLRRAAQLEYDVPREFGSPDTLRGTLLTLYDVEAETQRDRLAAIEERLRDDIAVSSNIKTGLVTLYVTSPYEPLAEALAAKLLELLGEFNRDRHRTRARAEREFLEERRAEALTEMTAAEGRLEEFLLQNRNYEGSPTLSFDASRLRRQVDQQQQIYLSIAQSYEQARLDEIHEALVFTIVDRPAGSAVKTFPPMTLMVMLGFIIGVGAAGTAVFWREYSDRQRRMNPDDYALFRAESAGLRRQMPFIGRRTS